MEGIKDGDERVLATAQKILKSLGTSKNVKDDMILILSNFDNRFSAITDLLSAGAASFRERLAAAEEVVLGRGSDPRLRWEDSPVDSAAYLSAVDDTLKLIEDLSVSPAGEGSDVSDRAESLLQLAMSKLEDEFRDILMRSTVPLDDERTSGLAQRSFLSFASNDCESEDPQKSPQGEKGSSQSERGPSLRDLTIDLVNPDAIDDLRDIAERMIRAGYEKECCGIYSSVRRDVLDECLLVLGVEKLGIEELQKIGWKTLDEKMKKWIRAVKILVRVVLSAEERLCHRIFAGSEPIKEVCFGQNARFCVMQLMIFAEAIVIGQRSSEKLFRILDMYDALADLLPDLHTLFSDESGKFVCEDVEGVLAGLGKAAKGTLVEFEKAVQSEASRKPVQGGDIHPLSRYVMNYAKLLVYYSDSLNLLLENDFGDPDDPQVVDDSDNDILRLGDGSPLSKRLLLLISYLESNLGDKSKLYEDKGLQHVFLMNNVLYIVQKVKGSELGKFLGTLWVRRHQGLIRQYSTGYLRASWSKALSCLKDEGIWGGGNSSNVSKMVLKARFKNFNSSFEEVYRNQTAWKVPDPQLREELRISISEKVLPAYRSFLGRFRSHIDSGRHPGKYIKYAPMDLENYILDFFEGNSGVAHHLRKKSSG